MGHDRGRGDPSRSHAQGAVTLTTGAARVRPRRPSSSGFERAADGAMWMADKGCNRLVRAHRRRGTRIALGRRRRGVAPDARGGMWFAAAPTRVGHVDAGGTVRTLDARGARHAIDVAVAPDGSAWFAPGSCGLPRAAGRRGADGARAIARAGSSASSRTGGCGSRAARGSSTSCWRATAGQCDDRSPAVHLPRRREDDLSAAPRTAHRGPRAGADRRCSPSRERR